MSDYGLFSKEPTGPMLDFVGDHLIFCSILDVHVC